VGRAQAVAWTVQRLARPCARKRRVSFQGRLDWTRTPALFLFPERAPVPNASLQAALGWTLWNAALRSRLGTDYYIRMPVISAEELTAWAAQMLEAARFPEPKARLVADVLVAANLRGVDSHGVQLLPYYIEQVERGDMDPHADGRVASESGGCLVYDGGNGVGAHIASACCGHAVRLAKKHGIAMVAARDSNHFGAAAYWGQKISGAGMIGMVMCNASPIVAPWQGKQPRLGTNPICVALPGPWLLDMATTTVAANRIWKALMNGEETIPAGWAMDSEGTPTTDTDAAVRGLPMPLGGYKGSGLAMMAEILCAVLSGGAMSTEVGGIRIHGKPTRVSQAFLAIDVSRFLPLEEFTGRVERLVKTVKSSAPAKGYHEVLVAGDPEWRAEAARRRDGIPVGEGTWESLTQTAERLGVAMPVGESRSV
jgi:LDH2 family malate/lactate/ureidoglycolate dehydrogenase